MNAGRSEGNYPTGWSVHIHFQPFEILTIDGLQVDARSSYLASFE